ncbi:hypothetical protein PFISCL1PPCAC_8331 [Pristionchus fissidentatus]|uniref:DNA mismatch repair proteins mutS family domain-containing protein n=1 Tax=Pristionchus fissidentatus TaxID=1538716 RepID=A0AAV5VGP0_9BILA|nr:hypothetical protein PFISCL1PPCAC_8331 [Pristionchus fissidentatus]
MSGSRRSMSRRSAERSRSKILDRLDELEEDREGTGWNPPRSSIILSLCYSGGTIGAAVYDQVKTTVHLIRDVAEESHFPVLSNMLEQVNPTRILSNCAQDVNMINFLSKACGISIVEDDDVTNTMDETLNTTRREEGETANDGPFIPPRSCSFVAKDAEVTKPIEETMDAGEKVQQWVNEQPSRTIRPSQKSITSTNRRDQTEGDEEDEGESDEEEETRGAPAITAELHKLSNCAYNCERALVRINELFESEALSECENSLITRFRIDTIAVNMVRALGALLFHMDNSRVGVEFALPTARTPISAIKTMLVHQMVEMDAMTFRALSIFAVDEGSDTTVKSVEHAKLIHKDRLSLFGMCCRCRGAPGKRMLRKWFERPTRDMTTLQNRLDAVEFLANDDNRDIVVFLNRVLKPVRSLKTTMKRLRASNLKINDWIGLHSVCLLSIHHLREFGELLQSGRFRLKIMNEFMSFFDDRLEELKTIMEALIDYDESRVENRMVVRMGLDVDLDGMKETYRSLPDNLTKAAKTEASRLGCPPSCAVGYVPMVGYLLQLPADCDFDQYDDLEFLYEDGEFLHVKSQMMRRLDEEIGDIKMQIIDRETTIMLRLERLLISRSRVIMTCVRAAAVIDCCLSLAATATMFNWRRPTLVEEAVLKASGVVHPLAQLTVDGAFVPNPIDSCETSTKVKIFTGPNACGKSVYLKQMGILCYLAHVGSFVPASKAKIGLLTGILTRMYTLDGVLDGMSTFAKDMGQLSFALRRATGSSLVIIDEFGKGTMTEVGLSLLTASIEHLTNKGKAACPHLLVSTHFHALIDLLETEKDVITYHTMEVLRQGAQLFFQFKMVEGVVNSSFAAFTASKGGIPQRAVDRSIRIYEHLRDGGRLCDMRLRIEEEEDMNIFLAHQMDSATEWMEGWNLNEEQEQEGDGEKREDEKERVDELVEMLRHRLFTKRELAVQRGEVLEEKEREEEEGEEMNEMQQRNGNETMHVEKVEEREEGIEDGRDSALKTVEEEESAELRTEIFSENVEKAKEDEKIGDEPSQRVYTFPWEHEDEEEESGEKERSSNNNDDVTFPWELEHSDEEEEQPLEDMTLDTSHAVRPHDTTSAEDGSGKTLDVLNTTTASILKGSLRRTDRTGDRSNLSVSFSKEVTMQVEKEKETQQSQQQTSPLKRSTNFQLFERLLRYSAEKVAKGETTTQRDGRADNTGELTQAVKRLRSH